jgi:hypothetical protein
VPRHSYDGLLGMAERGIVPERWRRGIGVAQEALVLGVGYLMRGEEEFIGPDPMHRLLVVLSGVAAHEEPSGRDGDESGNTFFGSGIGKHLS